MSDRVNDETPTDPYPEALPPTAPMTPPVAAHVPVADLPTAPLAPVDPPPGGAAAVPPAGRPRRNPWLWVIAVTLAAAAIVAVVVGLSLAGQDRPLPGVTGTPSSTPTPTVTPEETGGTDAPPAEEPPAPAPTEPAPAPTEPAPEPTEPAPTPTP